MSLRLPLEGITVVEFAHMVMGPTCGLILGDLGADVIKVEPLEGDHTRALVASGAGFFPAYNRNKRSLAVDLKAHAGREIVMKLIERADVVSENFRPGAMARLGLDYPSLRAANRALVYCSHKGFLPGPYEHRTALDEVVQMMGGLAYMTGGMETPMRAGASVNDVMGGMFGAIGILSALIERTRTGEGREVTTALFENNVFLMAQHMLEATVTGTPALPMPQRTRAWAVYDTFETADGGRVFVGVVTDTQWKVFCEAMGRHDLIADPGLATNPQRVSARPRILPIVSEHFRRLTAVEAMAFCEKHGLPFAPITRPEDLLDDPHLTASGGLAELKLPDGRTARTPLLPLALDRQRLPLSRQLPRVGEHTGEILRALGYDADAIARLAGEGVIGGDVA